METATVTIVGRGRAELPAALGLLILAWARPVAGGDLGFDTVFADGENMWNGEQVAMRVLLPADATVTSMTVYLQAGPPSDTELRYAVYSDSGAEPDALIVQSAVDTKGAGNVWKTIDLPDTLLAAGHYWLAVTTDHLATRYRYDESCGEVRHVIHNAVAGGFRAAWGASTASYNRRVSMFADLDFPAAAGHFEHVSSATGFNLVTTTGEDAPSGLYWADLDGDGDLDAIITGDSAVRVVTLNAGGGFTASPLGGGALGGAGALLDIDNDGDIDFWHRLNRLYLNDGAGGLADDGHHGFSHPDASGTEGLAAADVNGDGWCDLVAFSTNGNWIGHHGGAIPVVLAGTADLSYGLNGPGDAGDGDHVAAGDVNHDGFTDFFYHFGGGRLFRSAGDGTYVENDGGIGMTTGAARKVGSAWGDFDNDGDLDLFIPGHDVGVRGRLWRNDGGLFTDVAAAAGLADASGQRSACWGDYDNDGDLDLYIVTHSGAANVLYRNNGLGSFVMVDEGAAVLSDGQDAVFVDDDNDGDLDLAMTNGCAATILLRNTTDSAAYLKVRLIGWGAGGAGGGDAAAIGARVELLAADGETLLARRDIGVARGFAGAEPLWAHFGGVDPGATYVVRAHFGDRPVAVEVQPALASTVIGARTIPQMLTIEEPRPALRLIRWRETDPMFP